MKDVFDLNKLIDFESLVLKLSSAEEIRSWSHGEVLKPETINYRTLKPEKDGLFCERIFGPTKDWECYCGKYKRIRYKGIICEKCGVQVTQSRVRRERMGHISLATPIVHVWYFKGAPSRLSLLLGVTPKSLEALVYFAKHIVLSVDKGKKVGAVENIEKEIGLRKKDLEGKYKKLEKEVEKEEEKKKKAAGRKIKNKEQLELAVEEIKLSSKRKKVEVEEELSAEKNRLEEIRKTLTDLVKKIKEHSFLTEEEIFKLKEYKAAGFFKVGMGADALLSILKEIDLEKLSSELRGELEKSSGAKHVKLTKRLRVIEGLKRADLRPEGMILTVLPVIPPDLRPMVQLTGGRFATSDLNDLYRRVINRNNRLKHLIELGAPEIILRNEKRMLQEAVDALIDAPQRKITRRVRAGKVLKSLSDMLRGKQGRFRQNLLGKRVDYSGRSVIVVGPELRLNQCGLPKEMALEMFKPFVLRELIFRGYAPNVRSAKNVLDKKSEEVWDILDDITRNHPILLNRAPTLHKLGIQGFYPVLIEGNAIRIHPCICAGFNADFDGDQMAVHVPLSKAAIGETVNQMMPSHNLLKPADGSPITVPNKDMALGCFYVTSFKADRKQEKKDKRVFSNFNEAVLVYQQGGVDLREKILVAFGGKIIETSVGRILFNENLPEELRFVNKPIKAATIKELIDRGLGICDNNTMVELIDGLKDFGFWAVTLSGGISVSVFDCEMIENKDKYIKKAERGISEIEKNYQKGLITNEEMRRLSNEVWMDTTEKIADLTWEKLEKENSIRIIIESGGARASRAQLKQMSAMRGLVVDPLGKIVPLPTKSNFREGLSIFEYVTSTRGSRKGLTDSALKTANAGYLTRRMVDVAHDIIIRIDDCKTNEGIEVVSKGERGESFGKKVFGRVVLKNVVCTKTKKVLVKAGEVITKGKLELILKHKIKKVIVRSPLTCRAKHGICKMCYGMDLGTNKMVDLGVPVGVIAAQSIGEPGTQLTMRVRHTGGIVGLDMTQGLPRVEELFEARIPKLLSPISEIAGKIEVEEEDEGYKITIKSVDKKPEETREYFVLLAANLLISDGQMISAGVQLASGHLDIKEVLRVRGLRGAQTYLVDEIQKVYESQGIPINDKHFEIIVRKMSDKVKITEVGDTEFLPGELVTKLRFEKENARVIAEGGEPAVGEVMILGITKAALYTDSWLSAASFQETTNVLSEAAIKGAKDFLLGLKENVIIGRLIPTSPERALIEE